jgi:hypothetical protein
MVFEMEDLVVTAFISLLERNNKAVPKIAVSNLAKYKDNVLRALNSEDKSAVIPTSRYYASRFFYIYRDYFLYKENEQGDDYICLNEGKTLDDLKRRFSIYMPDDVQHCFSDEKNLEPVLAKRG